VRSGTVVAPLTGHGLKANEKMRKIASKGSASVGGATGETSPTG